MGVDTRLFISNRWTVEDVHDVLESLYGKAEYVSSGMPDYCILKFNYSKTEPRSMSAWHNHEEYGFRGVLLSLGANGHAQEIMEKIASRLGGLLNPEDVNDELIGYPVLGQHNLDFHVRHAIIHGETDGRDIAGFAKKAIAYSKSLGLKNGPLKL